jgi:hypothetical protein
MLCAQVLQSSDEISDIAVKEFAPLRARAKAKNLVLTSQIERRYLGWLRKVEKRQAVHNMRAVKWACNQAGSACNEFEPQALSLRPQPPIAAKALACAPTASRQPGA